MSYDGSSAQDIDDFGSKSNHSYNNLDLDGGAEKDLSGNTFRWGIKLVSRCRFGDKRSHLGHKAITNGLYNNRLIKGGSSPTVSVAYSSSSTNECIIPVGIDGSVRDISITLSFSISRDLHGCVYTWITGDDKLEYDTYGSHQLIVL